MHAHRDVRLRPLSLDEDLASAVRWYRDPEVLHFSEGSATAAYDERNVRAMYEHLGTDGEVFVIEALDDRGEWEAVGDAVLHPQMTPIVVGDARHRGRGLGSVVLQHLIARARVAGWSHLHAAKVFADNERSLRMLRSAGFEEVGRARDDSGRETIQLRLDLASAARPCPAPAASPAAAESPHRA